MYVLVIWVYIKFSLYEDENNKRINRRIVGVQVS